MRVGAMASAVFADLPSGATIVLCGCGFFLLSFTFGAERGCAVDLFAPKELAATARVPSHVADLLRTTGSSTGAPNIGQSKLD